MNVSQTQAHAFFAPQTQYVVPVWQRGFQWETDELESLWQDIERFLVMKEDRRHFLGTIVTREISKAGVPGEARQYELADGQQRITAVTLLAIAIRDQIAELSGGASADAFSAQVLWNSEHTKREHRAKLKLQDSKGDNLNLEALRDGTEADPTSLIFKGYQFFAKKLKNCSRARLDKIFTVITQNFEVAQIGLSGTDDTHRVFQTINALGKPLKPADIIRNFFFLRLAERGDRFFREYWVNIERNLDSSNLNHFFTAWMVSQGIQVSKKSLVLKVMRKFEDKSDDEVFAIGPDLVASADLFRRIAINAPVYLPKAVARELDWHRLWGATPAYGLILYLLQRLQTGEVPEKQVVECLQTLKSYLLRRHLLGFAPNNHRSLFDRTVEVIRALSAKGVSAADALRYRLSAEEETSKTVWPSNDDIRARLPQRIVYSRSSSNVATLRRCLASINYFSYDSVKVAPREAEFESHQIEHVLPQALNSAWRADLTKWGESDCDKVHNDLKHTIGNLTLTLQNPDLGQRPFAEKRKKLKDEGLKLSADITEKSRWTGRLIRERSANISELLCVKTVTPFAESKCQRYASLLDPALQIAIDFDSGDFFGEEDF